MRSDLPIVFSGDVIVNGGELAGVAAACAAARNGNRVFLAVAETYPGADICATGQLWSGKDTTIDTPMARELFYDTNGNLKPYVRPMDVKRMLETALLDAGVFFIYGAVPASLLFDDKKQIAGMVFTSRNGRFVVSGRAVVDASFTARAARAADLKFTADTRNKVSFKQVVIGHRAPAAKGFRCRRLGLVEGPADTTPAEAFEYSFKLAVPSWTPSGLATVEQQIRNALWHRDQNWIADRPWYLPQLSLRTAKPANSLTGITPFTTAISGLWVIGPCAAVSRPLAARLLKPGTSLDIGDRLGNHAAAFASTITTCGTPQLPYSTTPDTTLEPTTCDRFIRNNLGTLADPGPGELPLLGHYDVVVAGGGTGGAPAAIAAARAGARVLVIETLPELGGVGTAGMISAYWYGYREGFTAEISASLAELNNDRPRDHSRWVPMHKAEILRRKIRAAGGEVWYGAMVSGAIAASRRVSGVVVNTPWGRGIVSAGFVIDATGNADVAAAAGAPVTSVSTAELAIQGTGLAIRPWVSGYVNTDYTFADDADTIDATRVFVMARRKFAAQFDLSQIIDSRERRQIIGDVTVTAADVYRGRTWRDTICHSNSNFDSHGFTIDPLFIVEPPDHAAIDAWLPLRALIPKGWDGILATGLAISGQRDVMPVLRMQPDIQNHAYAVGLAAAQALRTSEGLIRSIDIRTLQRELVHLRRLIPGSVLLHTDTPLAATAANVASAAAGTLAIHAEIAVLMQTPEKAIPLLQQRLATETDTDTRIRCAKLLAVMGDTTGESTLIKALQGDWDEGWDYKGMGQFGRSLSLQDDCIIALGMIGSTRARKAILAKAATLTSEHAFSHFRAVATYCENIGGKTCASTLAALLDLPAVAGHDWPTIASELREIPPSHVDTITRNLSLREIYLARALFRCGDHQNRGKNTLERYAIDIRGHYARHAATVLDQR